MVCAGVLGTGFVAALRPPWLWGLSGEFSQHGFDDGDVWGRSREGYSDTGLHLVDAGGDLDEGVAYGLEGRVAPLRSLRRCVSQAKHEPVSRRM